MTSFNINRPTRRSWNDWAKDLQALSGVRDVSKDDMLHRMEQVVLSKDPVRAIAADWDRFDPALGAPSPADAYAAAEAADGRHREDHPNDPTET